MSVKTENAVATQLGEEPTKRKFSKHLTSPIVTVIVNKTTKFSVHLSLVIGASDRLSRGLMGDFKEAAERTVHLEDEDPELFGFFIEYLYGPCMILCKDTLRTSDYGTLARLYALGDRLIAPKFQTRCLWKFTENFPNGISIPEVEICELLSIAYSEIGPQDSDPLKRQIFWFGALKLSDLQKLDMFNQLMCDIPDLGRHLCFYVSVDQPGRPEKPNDEQFIPESEYRLEKAASDPARVPEEGKQITD